jgi:hypothetical protein
MLECACLEPTGRKQYDTDRRGMVRYPYLLNTEMKLDRAVLPCVECLANPGSDCYSSNHRPGMNGPATTFHQSMLFLVGLVRRAGSLVRVRLTRWPLSCWRQVVLTGDRKGSRATRQSRPQTASVSPIGHRGMGNRGRGAEQFRPSWTLPPRRRATTKSSRTRRVWDTIRRFWRMCLRLRSNFSAREEVLSRPWPT